MNTLPAVNHYICAVKPQNNSDMTIKYPPLDRKEMRRWYLNYTVSYQSESARKALEPMVSATIRNLAVLQGIACVISERGISNSDTPGILDNLPPVPSADLVYFHSTQYSRVSRSEFRKLLSTVFGGYPNIFHKACPFEVQPQTIEALKRFPFPDEKPEYVIEVPLKQP